MSTVPTGRPDERTYAALLGFAVAPSLVASVASLFGGTVETPSWWSAAVLTGVCLSVALLALAWMSVGTLLLIFAGVLLGVFLDGLTRGLGHVLPLPRGLRLTIASLAVAVAVIGFASYGGATIVQQGRDLGTTIKNQAGTVSSWLSERGIDVPSLAPKGGSAEPGHAV